MTEIIKCQFCKLIRWNPIFSSVYNRYIFISEECVWVCNVVVAFSKPERPDLRPWWNNTVGGGGGGYSPPQDILLLSGRIHTHTHTQASHALFLIALYLLSFSSRLSVHISLRHVRPLLSVLPLPTTSVPYLSFLLIYPLLAPSPPWMHIKIYALFSACPRKCSVSSLSPYLSFLYISTVFISIIVLKVCIL
jgi:hypothetical protein